MIEDALRSLEILGLRNCGIGNKAYMLKSMLKKPLVNAHQKSLPRRSGTFQKDRPAGKKGAKNAFLNWRAVPHNNCHRKYGHQREFLRHRDAVSANYRAGIRH